MLDLARLYRLIQLLMEVYRRKLFEKILRFEQSRRVCAQVRKRISECVKATSKIRQQIGD